MLVGEKIISFHEYDYFASSGYKVRITKRFVGNLFVNP